MARRALSRSIFPPRVPGRCIGMAIADQFIRTGSARRVLVIGAELLSRLVDWEDRSSCVLFGDAAGAMVLGPSPEAGRGLISTHLHSDGTAAGMLSIPGGGSKHPQSEDVLAKKLNKISMNGREVYKYATRALPEVVLEALAANGLKPDAIDHVVTHQANVRIVESVVDRLGIPREKCWLNIDRYGNTSSASLPISLDEANRAGRLRPGDLIAMMAIGAGMAWEARSFAGNLHKRLIYIDILYHGATTSAWVPFSHGPVNLRRRLCRWASGTVRLSTMQDGKCLAVRWPPPCGWSTPSASAAKANDRRVWHFADPAGDVRRDVVGA